MTFDAFDVVVVPFPFTDSAKAKRRPALVLSSSHHFNNEAKHSVMAMITSAKNDPWPLDVSISDLQAAGILAESVVRMKIFTLDHRFILKKVGKLSRRDQGKVAKNIKSLIGGI